MMNDYYLLNLKALSLYRDCARSEGKDWFQSYLSNKGITNQSADHFQLGLNLDKNLMVDYLMSLNEEESRVAVENALTIKLISRDERGLKDTFKNSIIYPCFDNQKRLVGFSTHTLNKEISNILFRNSPGSIIFDNFNYLFNEFVLDNSPDREPLLIVEGISDVIQVFQAGFSNVVGALSVNLAEECLSKIERYKGPIILIFDNDEAGDRATRSLISQLNEREVYIFDLLEQKDPEHFIKKYGQQAFHKQIKDFFKK